MDKSYYPALAGTDIIHLDTSAAFPLHKQVISAVDAAMKHLLGAPGKAQYESAVAVAAEEASIRQHIANFIGAEKDEVFLVASATDASRCIAELWATNSRVLFSPEDHSRIVHEVTHRCRETVSVTYMANGEYDYGMIAGSNADVAFLSHLHHIYGSDNNISTIRSMLPNAMVVVDASQSVSRIKLDVHKMDCDALFFSSQKLGGVAGIGVLYIAKKHIDLAKMKYIEPNTIPMIPLVSLDAAISVLEDTTITAIQQRLAKITADLIAILRLNPSIEFTKGPAYPEYTCYGNGIVSFSVAGYSSQDIAMILSDNNIQVRAGDHCVDPAVANQDVTRISMHMFTTDEDLNKVTSILATL